MNADDAIFEIRRVLAERPRKATAKPHSAEQRDLDKFDRIVGIIKRTELKKGERVTPGDTGERA